MAHKDKGAGNKPGMLSITRPSTWIVVAAAYFIAAGGAIPDPLEDLVTAIFDPILGWLVHPQAPSTIQALIGG